MKFTFCSIFFLLISFRCFSQLPAYTGTVYDSTSLSGYYFLCIHKAGIKELILDRTGNVVYYKPGKRGFSFNIQGKGMITTTDLIQSYIIDSSFHLIDSVSCTSPFQNDIHEFQLLPNGHFLMIGVDKVNMDLRKYPYWSDNDSNYAVPVRCGIVQEMDSNKNVVFEWNAKDHFDITDMDSFYINRAHNTVDWTHFNSAELDNDGNILISNRNFNEITKINHKDGSVMWRMGGKRNQFQFINCPVPFYGQHDVRRINNGHITLFDGGNHTAPHGARALEFEVDEKNKTATLVWSYTLDSNICSVGGGGNVQRLENMNTLVSYGSIPGNKISFVVVNPMGAKIFEFTFHDSINPYRVINYASLPWQLRRPSVYSFDSVGITYLKTTRPYTSYRWNNGSTDPVIPIGKTDEYYVFVPYGEGGFICSDRYNINTVLHTPSPPSIPQRKPMKNKR